MKNTGLHVRCIRVSLRRLAVHNVRLSIFKPAVHLRTIPDANDDDAQPLNSERRQVLELLHEDGALSPAQIAVELGKSRPAVRMLLKRMKGDLLVKKQGSKYIPTHSVSYSVTERD